MGKAVPNTGKERDSWLDEARLQKSPQVRFQDDGLVYPFCACR